MPAAHHPEPPADVLGVIRGALLGGQDENLFATIESAEDDDLWVQITGDAFNAAYPFDEDPVGLMTARGCPPPAWVSLADWEGGTYATFAHKNATAEDLGRLLMAYFAHVLGEENPTLDVDLDDLG